LNSLSRAKQFLAKKASKLALSVVPLAALALVPNARAGAVYAGGTLETGACSVSPSGAGSCSTTQASATGGNTNLNWIQMYGSGSVSGGGSLYFFASGSGFGSISAGVVPVSWDFKIQNVQSSVDWSLRFDIFLTNSGSGSFSQSGSMSSDGSVTGSSQFNVPSGSVSGWDIRLNTSSQSGSYSVTIPSGSTLDLNSPAPEPSTILLTSLGGAALLLRRRKRKA